jgi:hypothetical protein
MMGKERKMCAERTDSKATWRQKNGRGSVQADRVRVMLVVNLASHSPVGISSWLGTVPPSRKNELAGRVCGHMTFTGFDRSHGWILHGLGKAQKRTNCRTPE